jgi:hypothetical protein
MTPHTKLKASLILSVVLFSAASGFCQDKSGPWNETRAVTGLDFCALILREFFDTKTGERTLYLLAEPKEVTESRLQSLFASLSAKYADDSSLEVWVETDVEQLGSLATGRMVTVSPREHSDDRVEDKKVLQLALYKRNSSVELFRFNPNYPKSGEKTIIIRGQED